MRRRPPKSTRTDTLFPTRRSSDLLLRYDETYQNEQGISPQFRDHLEHVLARVTAAFGDGDILEVGCGKGLFVELMRSRGLRARGVDDAYEGHAPYIEKRHFGTAAETPDRKSTRLNSSH